MKNLILVILAALLAPSAFGQTVTKPGHAVDLNKPLAQVRMFGGIQHRAVIYKTGIVKFFYGARNGQIAEINVARVTALKKLIAQMAANPKSVEANLAANCVPPESKVFEVFTEDDNAIVIERVNECGYERVANRDQRIIDLLNGMMALVDLLK
jgi:hypothetical protein